MPFREADGRLWGPGVLDMKSGMAFFVFACAALRELDICPCPASVLLQVNADEEVGSESSRALTEKNAPREQGCAGAGAGHGADGQAQDGAQRRGRRSR